MATFVSEYSVQVTQNEDGTYAPGLFSSTATVTYSDGDDSSNAFSTADLISTVPNGPSYIYVSHDSQGFVGQVVGGPNDGQYYYIGTQPPTLDTNGNIDTQGGDFVVCFLAGTAIATPDGARAVEDLAAGDTVLTADGATRAVLWVGRQTVATRFADALRSYPIRIAADALAENVPARDLYVSPDHGILVDGALIQAGALVNGTSITRVEPSEETFAYYHVELEDHALVLAEGAVTETFVDNVSRRRFDNYAEYEAMFGDSRAHIPELALPRVKSARQIPAAVSARIEERARAIGVAHAVAA